MIERPQGGDRVILVHINFPAGNMQEDLTEFKELAISAGADLVDTITGARKTPEAKLFIGKGKAEEVRLAAVLHKADLVIFNHSLSPAQERNLETLLSCRVLDRTGLILDIFAKRARSFEGKLQVELALLKHLATRLVRGWTHLERQRGGIGLRGPGETQLETDRRLLRNRIKYITSRLERVKKQRSEGRKKRQFATIPTVAIVGYTNAGKSTLFNALTGASVYAADRLFATLDPTLRRLDLPGLGHIILADTVGFIRHLPHDLIDAFHATLQEVSEANLLLHVVDASDPDHRATREAVLAVLNDIGAEAVPQLLIYNKMDLCDFLPSEGVSKKLWVSAVQGVGIPSLLDAIGQMLSHDIIEKDVILQPSDGSVRAKLYNLGAVLSETISSEGNYHLRIRITKREMEKLFT